MIFKQSYKKNLNLLFKHFQREKRRDGVMLLLLLLLSRFSRVRLCATPQTAAHQAPPSLGFSSKNSGVGCHFPLQCMKVKSESEVPQQCPTPHDPIDCSLPGSSVHGSFQARVPEWGAIAFSGWCYKLVINMCPIKQQVLQLKYCYEVLQKKIFSTQRDYLKQTG